MASTSPEFPDSFAPLVDALKDAGVNFPPGKSYLNTEDESFFLALPILMEHLERPNEDRVLEYILQHLSTSKARRCRADLVRLYKSSSHHSLDVRFGFAVAISKTSKSSDIEDNVSMARDTSLGQSRLGLLIHIARSRKSVATEAIDALAEDADLEKEIAAIRSRRTGGMLPNHSVEPTNCGKPQSAAHLER